MTDIGNASEQQDVNDLGVQEQEPVASNENTGDQPVSAGTPEPTPTASADAPGDEATTDVRGGAEAAASAPSGEAPEVAATEPTSTVAVEEPTAPAGDGGAPQPAAAPSAQEVPVAASAAPSQTADQGGETSEASTHDEPSEASAEGGGESRHGRSRRQPKLSEEQMRELWTDLAGKRDASEEIDLEILSHNRGGVVAQYKGLEVFIPMSHWSLDKHTQGVSNDVRAGDKITANVLEMTEFETDARRVTATRRSILRKQLLESLEVGQHLSGRVTSILDFGIFVDLGGIDGLVHASEISHAHAKHPSEQVNKGQEVNVVIKEIDRDKKRIYLGMKELLPSPWDNVEEKYPVDTIQQGKVAGLSKTGAFIELEPGIDGFVRLRELSWTKRVHHPKEVLKKGMDVAVKVLDASAKKQRLSLSYRQAQEDPWPMIVQKYSLGTRWEGEVREISNKGVVVSVGELEGFLPRGRMGREAKRLPEMKIGEKLNVHVVDVDPKGLSVIFGLSTQDGEEGGGGGGGRGRGDGHEGRGERGDRRDRDRTAPPTQPENELKNAGNVGSFSIGDMIGEAIKKRLNFDTDEGRPHQAAPAAPVSAPEPTAPVAAQAAEAPAPMEAVAPEAVAEQSAVAEAQAPPPTEAPASTEGDAPAADQTDAEQQAG